MIGINHRFSLLLKLFYLLISGWGKEMLISEILDGMSVSFIIACTLIMNHPQCSKEQLHKQNHQTLFNFHPIQKLRAQGLQKRYTRFMVHLLQNIKVSSNVSWSLKGIFIQQLQSHFTLDCFDISHHILVLVIVISEFSTSFLPYPPCHPCHPYHPFLPWDPFYPPWEFQSPDTRRLRGGMLHQRRQSALSLPPEGETQSLNSITV